MSSLCPKQSGLKVVLRQIWRTGAQRSEIRGRTAVKCRLDYRITTKSLKWLQKPSVQICPEGDNWFLTDKRVIKREMTDKTLKYHFEFKNSPFSLNRQEIGLLIWAKSLIWLELTDKTFIKILFLIADRQKFWRKVRTCTKREIWPFKAYITDKNTHG